MMDATVSNLAAQKTAFLDDVKAEIDTYIVNQRSHCIDVVERNSPPKSNIIRTHRASLDPDFAEVLYKFARHKTYNGHVLDSALTDPVGEIVIRKYQDFYENNGDIINEGLIKSLAENNLVLNSVLDKVADKILSKYASQVRSKIVEKIVHQIHDAVSAGTLHTVGHHVGAAAAHAAATTVGTAVLQIIAQLLAAHIGTIIAKVMTSAFVKKIVAVIAKKCVATLVLSFMATHVGAAAGGVSVGFILFPLLVAYLGYKINTFPKILGKKVSESVRSELDNRFNGMNKDILEKMFNELIDGEKLVECLADNEEIGQMMKDMAKDL
jgi:hypothetical protein